MPNVLLESLSTKQILVLCFSVFSFTVVFFVMGGTKASNPANASYHIATMCVGKDTSSWYWRDSNETCTELKDLTDSPAGTEPDDIAFSIRIPHKGFAMSRYHQFIAATINFELEENIVESDSFGRSPEDYHKDCTIEFNAKIGYRNDENEPWTELAGTTDGKRPLSCLFSSSQYSSDHPKSLSGYFTCDDMYLFELGSAHHKYYLLNLRLKGNKKNHVCIGKDSKLKAIHLVEIHQNGGYTLAWFVSKTVSAPLILMALVFFSKRLYRESRESTLLEKAVFGLGVSMFILLVPIEWFTLVANLPFMLLLSDIRQGQFYAMLLSFWCIFAGEHILDQHNRNSLKSYRVQLTAVICGCLSLLTFDLIERGTQLNDPFHTVWKKDSGETAARVLVVLFAFCAALFGLFFIYLIYKVFQNIRIKEVALPVMQDTRKKFYQGIIFRFRFLVGFTVFCAIFTVVCFILDHINEMQWKFIEDDPVNHFIKLSSALHFGTFGLWIAYVFVILILYSPSATVTTHGNRVIYQAAETGSGEGSVDDSLLTDHTSKDLSFVSAAEERQKQ